MGGPGSNEKPPKISNVKILICFHSSKGHKFHICQVANLLRLRRLSKQLKYRTRPAYKITD